MAVERLAMTPKSYMESMLADPADPVKAILSPKQFDESKPIFKLGYELIGERIEEHFGRSLTPEVVQITTALQQLLCVFVEHVNNPVLVRKMIGLLA